MVPFGRARGRLRQSIVPAQKVRPALEIGRIDEALGRDGDEVAVGHEEAAVGEGEARGVADDAPRLCAVGAEAG